MLAAQPQMKFWCFYPQITQILILFFIQMFFFSCFPVFHIFYGNYIFNL